MKYKCLVLDHDDTVVDSTAGIHYPSFIEALEFLRPDIHITLSEYILYNFDPGFSNFLKDILKFSQAETEYQFRHWNEYVASHVPKAYEGFGRLLSDFRARGGHICVISHSLSSNILRDYSENNLPRPELIYGWEFPPEKRKPSPWPLLDAMDKLGIDSGDVLMVDDLKPGKMMADSCGVDFAAAGWGHSIPIIREYMKNSCTNYLTTVSDLYKLVFKGIS